MERRSKDYQEWNIAVFNLCKGGEESGRNIKAHALLSRDGETKLPLLALHNTASFLGELNFCEN
jgi:hypothetical protein